MPRVVHNQNSFTAGEISPRLNGRGDVARYQAGAETIENGVVAVHGGVIRRDGMRFLGATKDSGARKSRLIRFVLDVDQAYILEFGHNYIRFMDGTTGARILDAGLATLELASPYTEAQLFEITTKQAVDVMYLFHREVQPHILRRMTATRWAIYPIPFGVLPFSENGHYPEAALSLSATTSGAGRVFSTTPISAPGAPTIGTAYPLDGAAIVHFTPPAGTGGVPVDSYTVTSSPGGITATGDFSPIRVNGLTNGTTYTFTVKASNGVGTSPASSASNSVTPSTGAGTGALSVNADPINFYQQAQDGQMVSMPGPTATAAGGTAPYFFSWSKISGSPRIVVKQADQAQPTIDSFGYGTNNYAVLRCTVTDAAGLTGSVDVNVTFRHGSTQGGQYPIEER